MRIRYWGEYLGKRGKRSGENYIMKSLMICDPTKCYSGDEMRRMKWTGHVARMGKGEINTGIWWGNLMLRNYLENKV